MKEGLDKKTSNNHLENQEKELFLEKIGELESAIEELKGKVEKGEAINRELKKLFNILAHDLKNPVNNVAFALESILSDYKDGSLKGEKLVNLLELAYSGSKNTSVLLNNLLTWSRLQQDDGIKMNITPRNLAKEIDSSVGVLLEPAGEKGINFDYKVADNINAMADSAMLQIVIRNLASNAIKFTHTGGKVSVSSERKGDKVEICVKDNGVGMSEEQMKNPFGNAGISTTGTNGETGTGLGLHICFEMVEKMGGALTVESEKDKGTKFTIILPYTEQS